jgi:hypothetical protein
MTALWLDWLMVTEPEPWPWMVALPPTTVPPLGPASAGNAASTATVTSPASVARVVSTADVVSRNRLMPVEWMPDDWWTRTDMRACR